jgi:hypothetical protein
MQQAIDTKMQEEGLFFCQKYPQEDRGPGMPGAYNISEVGNCEE